MTTHFGASPPFTKRDDNRPGVSAQCIRLPDRRVRCALMYEHLLVALDGSAAAEAVLDHVVALASAFGSRVTLLRATVSTERVLAETAGPTGAGDAAALIDPTPILDADRETVVAYLREVAAGLENRGLRDVTFEHPDGPPGDAIRRRASELGASLLVMTTRGRSGLERIVFGSVADSVLHHAPCPVLLVGVSHDDAAG